MIELQPHINIHNRQDHELSPPPCYSPPPSYQPPPYSDLLARDLIAESSPDGGPAQTTLAPNDGQFIARCGSPIPGMLVNFFFKYSQTETAMKNAFRWLLQHYNVKLTAQCIIVQFLQVLFCDIVYN